MSNEPVKIKVVGLTFMPNYPENLKRLMPLAAEADNVGEALSVVLIRNPANPHDANAIEVHIPSLGEDGMVGHLPARSAAILAPALDAGGRFRCWLHWIRFDPMHPANPGLDIMVQDAMEPS